MNTNKEEKINKEEKLITSHANFGFDALSAMFCAQKIYKDSFISFPSKDYLKKFKKNPHLANFLSLFNTKDNLDNLQIKKLIIVDTKQKNNIGEAEVFLKNPKLKIDIFDNSPDTTNDIIANKEINYLTATTTSILALLLKKKKIKISSNEATLICLGIYEASNYFRLTSTSAKDFEAASFLISCGAKIEIISKILSFEKDLEENLIINNMLKSCISYKIQGQRILISKINSRFGTQKDYERLILKMFESKMQKVSILFAFVKIKTQINVFGFSRVYGINFKNIFTKMNGYCEDRLCFFSSENETMPQVEEKLLKAIKENILPKKQARDFMTSPVICIDENKSCNDASNILTRYSLNALIVEKKISENKKEVTGYINRAIIEKAIHHNLGLLKVKEYCLSDFIWVEPNTDIDEIYKQLNLKKQDILPVIENKNLLGVITLTDIFDTVLQKDKTNKIITPNLYQARKHNINSLLVQYLNPRIIKILEDIGKSAKKLGYQAYLVGGVVRDILLHKKNDDIDIVVEGCAIALAEEYAKEANVTIKTFDKFKTAQVLFEDGFKIDLASSRIEYYQSPGAMPQVKNASIQMDLYRRDFSINTLIVALNPEYFGNLIDFFGAQKDIKDKFIRILHNLSFVEDPTRAFRAIRFEQRFNFSIGSLTQKLINNMQKMKVLNKVRGFRILTELCYIFNEDNLYANLKRLEDFKLLSAIDSNLKVRFDLEAFIKIKENLIWYNNFNQDKPKKWIIYLMALSFSNDKKTMGKIIKRLEIVKSLHALLTDKKISCEEKAKYIEDKSNKIDDSKLYDIVKNMSGEEIVYLLLLLDASNHLEIKNKIKALVENLKSQKIFIRGKELKNLGVAQGPIYREILKELFLAKLRKKIITKDDEIKWVKNKIKEKK